MLSARSHILRRLSPLKSRYPSRTWTSVTTSRDALTIHSLNDTAFPYTWLRDSCQSPECIHPSTRQKLHRSSDIPTDIQPLDIKEAEVITPDANVGKGLRVLPNGLQVTWTDGHTSFFDKDFLKIHSSPETLSVSHFSEYTSPTPWTSSTITQSHNLFVPYSSFKETSGLVDVMTQLLKFGLVFVTGVPTESKSTENCELRVLAERIGEIRKTFYGELWDVINISGSKNIAYTNLDLGLHMDILYFQHPPRFQALHALRNRVIGGTSVFVDALNASHALFHSNRAHFDILTKTPVAFQYLNDGHHLYMKHPTIQLETPSEAPLPSSASSPPPISHINYSPPFQGPLPLSTPSSFYPALREFTEILNDPSNTYSYTLKEGDCVLFDNRRVLHARTAFEEKQGADKEEGLKFGTGEDRTNRWLKGCYLEADAVSDRMRIGRTKKN